jgi:hypothetical protein
MTLAAGTCLKPRNLDPTVPRAVDGIVRKCLEKRREDRFQGAPTWGSR